MKIILETRRVQ